MDKYITKNELHLGIANNPFPILRKPRLRILPITIFSVAISVLTIVLVFK